MSRVGIGYARVYPSFWDGETGRALLAHGADAVVVATFLLSNRLANPLGLYQIPLSYIAAHMPQGSGDTRETLRKVMDAGFCQYDETSTWIFIPSAAEWQIAAELKPSDNKIPWIRRMASEAKKSPFYRAFISRYGRGFHLGDAPPEAEKGDSPGAPRKAPASPFEGASDDLEAPSEAFPSHSTPLPLPSHPNPDSVGEAADGAVGGSPAAKRPPPKRPPRASDLPPPGEATPPQRVFLAWVRLTGRDPARWRLTPDRLKRIRARLADGFSEADLEEAIRGCLKSPHHQGRNDSGTVFDDIELICRSAGKVEKFAALARGEGGLKEPTNGQQTESDALLRAKQREADRKRTSEEALAILEGRDPGGDRVPGDGLGAGLDLSPEGRLG